MHRNPASPVPGGRPGPATADPPPTTTSEKPQKGNSRSTPSRSTRVKRQAKPATPSPRTEQRRVTGPAGPPRGRRSRLGSGPQPLSSSVHAGGAPPIPPARSPSCLRLVHRRSPLASSSDRLVAHLGRSSRRVAPHRFTPASNPIFFTSQREFLSTGYGRLCDDQDGRLCDDQDVWRCRCLLKLHGSRGTVHPAPPVTSDHPDHDQPPDPAPRSRSRWADRYAPLAHYASRALSAGFFADAYAPEMDQKCHVMTSPSP